jgi:DNA sulfur modification protein DndD
MEIKSIRLKDFRQFYGDQTIILAGKGKRNVTLIHAENGVGKTTLLNSVLWTFFGETTKKFEQKDRVVNFVAEKEGQRSARVDVVFSHEGIDYLASRNHQLTAGGYSKPRFSVMKYGKNGSLGEPLDNPDAFINTVIPAVMAPYFFFDGEQAETFAAETNNKAIAAAIRDILGSTLIENGIKDLQYVAKKFNEELGDSSGDEEIVKRERRITQLEAEKDKRSDRIDALGNEIDAYQEQIRAIGAKLLEAKEAASYEQLRREKKSALDLAKSQSKDVSGEILRWLSTKTLPAISKKLTSVSLDFIDEESLKGRIPSPYNEDFVKGLLTAKRCVCERALEPGSSEWRAISSLLSSAANAEVLSRIVRVRSRIGMLNEQRADAPGVLKVLEEKQARLVQQVSALEREIGEISLKLQNLPVAEIQERERARRELEVKLEAAKTERIRAIRDNEHADEEIRRLNREVADLALKNVAARELIVRRDLANRAAEFLDGYLKANEVQAREEIESTVNTVLAKTTRKHYRFAVDDSFQIRLLFEDGTPTPKSGGENQMMSLAFLAALVQFAEKRSVKDDNGLFVPATVAPLILDSPFGQLDDAYREATAKFVPEMAPQVVLLVSSSQGKAEVISALEERVGAEYVLVAQNAGPKGDKKQDFLTVGGKRMATTLFSCDRTMTTIVKVES